MGNCCGGEADKPGSGEKTSTFQGQGHRLGSANETLIPLQTNAMNREDESLPEPIHNPNLTNDDRERQRAAQLAAAEARVKTKQPKKPKKSSGEPLRGPNSKPSMTWNM